MGIMFGKSLHYDVSNGYSNSIQYLLSVVSVWREQQPGGLFALPEAAFFQAQSSIQQSDAKSHQGVFLDHQLPLFHQAHAKR